MCIEQLLKKSMIIHLHPPLIVILRPLCSNTTSVDSPAGQYDRRKEDVLEGSHETFLLFIHRPQLLFAPPTIVIALSLFTLFLVRKNRMWATYTDQEVFIKAIALILPQLLRNRNSVQRTHVSQASKADCLWYMTMVSLIALLRVGMLKPATQNGSFPIR